MKRIANMVWGISAAVAISFAAANAGATTVADWTFETSAPTTAGPFSPEVGAGSATGSHAGTVVYSSPAGNGSSHSFSSNGWMPNDYYQFQVSTLGLGSVTVSWDQNGSATGPGSYQFEYSTDGTTFTPFGSAYTLASGITWSAGTPNQATQSSDDLSAITAINNQSTVFFRLVDVGTIAINGSTVGTAGTDRVDNFTVTATAVPEPSTIIMVGVGLFGMLVIRRRCS